jgi:hypothetical protein
MKKSGNGSSLTQGKSNRPDSKLKKKIQLVSEIFIAVFCIGFSTTAKADIVVGPLPYTTMCPFEARSETSGRSKHCIFNDNTFQQVFSMPGVLPEFRTHLKPLLVRIRGV